ncbi:MAG: DUF3368 domain-containing protein [Candidatus Helarchaeota archaeon]|nr:DUF3368 domain-containing protein [Candidatus Helarchaeota archaeon]
MPKAVVVNTSCLIALDKIGKLDLLCKLYDEVLVPLEVQEEFGNELVSCMLIKKVRQLDKQLLIEELNLGKGEAAAIALALETNKICVIDDLRARKIAKKMDVKITGTIGILLLAEKKKIINSAYNEVKSLQKMGFFVSESLIKKIKKS